MDTLNKYTVNCHSCVDPQNDAKRMILRTDTCIGVLRIDHHGLRGWLGRAVYYTSEHLKPPEAVLISVDRTRCAMMHFIACQRLFGASRINTAEAGNKNIDEKGEPTCDLLYHHPHQHVIPRYQNKIMWNGKIFVDHSFYQPMELNPCPSIEEQILSIENNVNVSLDLDEILLLKEEIQKELIRMIFDETIPNIFRPKKNEILTAYPSEVVIKFYKTFF